MPNMIIYKRIKTPVGEMSLGAFGSKICFLEFHMPDRFEEMSRRICKLYEAEFVEGTCNVIEKAEKELREYFEVERKEFSVPLVLRGTEFELKIWKQLQKIPYGQVCSYSDMANKINSPKSVRAVGGANHNNPIAIIIPCHRVVGKNGSLVGYGGGMDKKKFLIELERGEIPLL